MLILSRRPDESILIGDDIKITILSIKGKQIRIGIDAPAELSVHREEIYKRIQNGEPETCGQVSTVSKDIDRAWRERKKQGAST